METTELWRLLHASVRELSETFPSTDNRSFGSLCEVEKKLEGCVRALTFLKQKITPLNPPIDQYRVEPSPFPSIDCPSFTYESSKMDSPNRPVLRFSKSSDSNAQPSPQEAPRKRIRSELDDNPVYLPPLSFVRESPSNIGNRGTTLPPLRHVLEKTNSSPHEIRRHFSTTQQQNRFGGSPQTPSPLSAPPLQMTIPRDLQTTSPSLGKEFASLHPGIVLPKEGLYQTASERSHGQCRTSETPECQKGPEVPKEFCNEETQRDHRDPETIEGSRTLTFSKK